MLDGIRTHPPLCSKLSAARECISICWIPPTTVIGPQGSGVRPTDSAVHCPEEPAPGVHPDEPLPRIAPIRFVIADRSAPSTSAGPAAAPSPNVSGTECPPRPLAPSQWDDPEGPAANHPPARRPTTTLRHKDADAHTPDPAAHERSPATSTKKEKPDPRPDRRTHQKNWTVPHARDSPPTPAHTTAPTCVLHSGQRPCFVTPQHPQTDHR
ncbi:hypothetical protein EMCRGX_G029176 [Ephydatia muelleri]